MPSRIPDDLQKLYEIHNWRHAEAILAGDFPLEFAELCDALRAFRISEAVIKKAGGNESDIPKRLSKLLRPKWTTERLSAKLVVGETIVRTDSHYIDYCHGRVACDLEWNSKDQTFDRDLAAFRLFWDYDKISIGVLVTRSNELDPYFDSLGTYVNKHGETKRYKDKYGASTTHMAQLLRRLHAGRSGGCPVLVFGITPRLLEGV